MVSNKTEKFVAFSDFDAFNEITRLSKSIKTFYFCFEEKLKTSKLKDFGGYIKKVGCIDDLVNGLAEINQNSYESLKHKEDNENDGQ